MKMVEQIKHVQNLQVKVFSANSPSPDLNPLKPPPLPFFSCSFLNLSSVSVSLCFQVFTFKKQVSTATVTNSETGGFVSAGAGLLLPLALHCNLHFPFPPSLPLQLTPTNVQPYYPPHPRPHYPHTPPINPDHTPPL